MLLISNIGTIILWIFDKGCGQWRIDLKLYRWRPTSANTRLSWVGHISIADSVREYGRMVFGLHRIIHGYDWGVI